MNIRKMIAIAHYIILLFPAYIILCQVFRLEFHELPLILIFVPVYAFLLFASFQKQYQDTFYEMRYLRLANALLLLSSALSHYFF